MSFVICTTDHQRPFVSASSNQATIHISATPNTQTIHIVGVQGMAGAMLPNTFNLNSDIDLSGNMVVVSTPTGCAYADQLTLSHCGLVLGITNKAAVAGTSVQIMGSGEMNGLSGLTVGLPIYLGLNGNITQTVPTIGIVQQLGIATGTNSININMQTPFIVGEY